MNRIDVGIEFSYQGQTHHPKATLDLDGLMQSHGKLPDLHRYLAQQFAYDTYSYLYEVMEAHPIEYSNATGLARDHLVDGQFDLAGFEQDWYRQRQSLALADIARTHMGVEDLTAHPQLEQALLAAYRLGSGEADTPSPD